ncbi:hypothetical protein BDW67DRAFT_186285 [Aspergillus spinulosporus]
MDATASRLKVHELLDFTTTTLWPHFRAQDYASNCCRSWVYPLEESNQLLLYAVLWAASYHRDILRITCGAAEPQLESNERLELKSLVLQELQKEVANISEPHSPDALVRCILYLAVNERHKTRILRDSSPFSPPFMDLQALDSYRSRDYHPLHWKVVQEIVQRFGGIQNLRVFALAWLLCLSDLMTGSGFHDLFYIWAPVRQELVSVLIHLGQYSSIIQHYAASGEPCSPAVLDLLGDSRNLIHHRLLSLPDENDPTEAIIQCKGQTDAETDLSREIYLTVRLSAILYAVHVTFPLPRSQPVRESLLEALYPRLDELCTQNVSQPVILWCVTVAMSMPDKTASAPSTLVSFMARLCQDVGVDSSDKLVALLESFAWVDAAVQYTELGGCDALQLHSHSHSHPTLDVGDEPRLEMHAQCRWTSPQVAEQGLQVIPAMSLGIQTPTLHDDIFSFPSTSTESSPHMPHLAVSERQSTSTDIEFVAIDEQHHKTTLRRSQNRQAQRRFRERKEAQKTELLSRLDELQSKHDAMASKLESMHRRSTTLDSEKCRLEREVDTLRKSREKILKMLWRILCAMTGELLVGVWMSC